MCLVKTMIEIKVKQKIIYYVWLKIMAQFDVIV